MMGGEGTTGKPLRKNVSDLVDLGRWENFERDGTQCKDPKVRKSLV